MGKFGQIKLPFTKDAAKTFIDKLARRNHRANDEIIDFVLDFAPLTVYNYNECQIDVVYEHVKRDFDLTEKEHKAWAEYIANRLDDD